MSNCHYLFLSLFPNFVHFSTQIQTSLAESINLPQDLLSGDNASNVSMIIPCKSPSHISCF